MTVRKFALSLSLAAAFAQPALAGGAGVAQLGSVKGDVRISEGSGLAAARSGAELQAGDRIVARSGSAALRYADGCVVTVPAGAMATIGAASPCAGGAGLINPGSSSALTLPGLGRIEGQGYIALVGVTILVGTLILAAVNEDDPTSP